MAINNDLLVEAINIISSINGIQMDSNALVDDVVLVALVYDEEPVFKTAIANITTAFNLIVQKRNIGTSLRGNLSGWASFHFQSQRTQGHPADLRIVYQDVGADIQVRGFGNRHLPNDFYKRLYGR